MQKLIDPVYLEAQSRALLDWLLTEVLVLSSLGQIGVIVIAYLIAFAGRRQWSVLIALVTHWRGADNMIAKTGETLSVVALPFIWLVLQYIFGLIAAFAGWPHHLMTVTVSLLTVWIIIRLTAVLIRDKSWAKAITIGAWTVAAVAYDMKRTGRNVAADGDVANGVDPNGLFGWIDNYCRANPLKSIENAVLNQIVDLKKK